VAGRLKILGFIGQGGMGEVYEAEDLELNQKVALKTPRSRQLDKSNAIARFRKEIKVARRVTHPNVCRTFDLFRHTSPAFGGDILVVSVELLRGENLEEWLCQRGPLNTDEARPLVKQMVAGLHAAHEAGVVHRDFKTRNVMLVASGPGSHALRAVITDFGLATRRRRMVSPLQVRPSSSERPTTWLLSRSRVRR
jgi:serine/threonine protein kinase